MHGIDPLGLVNISPNIPDAKGKISINAAPGPKVSSETWKTITKADAAKMTKEQAAFFVKTSPTKRKKHYPQYTM